MLSVWEREDSPAGTMGSDPAMETSSNHIVALGMHLLSFSVTTAWLAFWSRMLRWPSSTKRKCAFNSRGGKPSSCCIGAASCKPSCLLRPELPCLVRGSCRESSCRFAHSLDELRAPPDLACIGCSNAAAHDS